MDGIIAHENSLVNDRLFYRDCFISLLIDSPKVDCCALRILSVISQEGSYSIITIKIRNYFKIVIAGIVSKGASIASDG